MAAPAAGERAGEGEASERFSKELEGQEGAIPIRRAVQEYSPLRFKQEICVLEHNNALNWFPGEDNEFVKVPTTNADITALREFLHDLPNGSCMPVRGRDWSGPRELTNWDYGVGVKSEQRLFFLWDSGVTESFLIDGINFRDLVEFAKLTPVQRQLETLTASTLSGVRSSHVVLLCHGFSPDVGPSYPIIRTMEMTAMRKGWSVIVPDFRDSYRFGSQRGRSERVRLIYEELLCLPHPKPTVVLVGHSQGGAAVASACNARVVQHGNVRGLLLVGAESPLEFDGLGWIPPVRTQIIHAKEDGVVSWMAMEQAAKRWGCPIHVLPSKVQMHERWYNQDEVAHDFLAKDLMRPCLDLFASFLDEVERDDDDAPPSAGPSRLPADPTPIFIDEEVCT